MRITCVFNANSISTKKWAVGIYRRGSSSTVYTFLYCCLKASHSLSKSGDRVKASVVANAQQRKATLNIGNNINVSVKALKVN